MLATPNIIVCCDGTSNTFGSEDTNVRRVFDLVDVDGQIRYYDPGVGTLPSDTVGSRFGRKLSRILGKAVALGLTANILEAYAFLMQHYDGKVAGNDASKVFLFGYSRGALTVRRLAKFVDNCGLPPKGNMNLIPYAWDAYRSYKSLEQIKDFSPDWKDSDVPDELREDWRRFHSFRDISVKCKPHFVGVWDTVRSIGTNFDGITCRLSAGISHARHAVAYHEKRPLFKPELWKPEKGDRIKQRWFAGDHGDVGGGHRYINGDKKKPITMENDLSLMSLLWILEEATKQRIHVKQDKYGEYKAAVEAMRSQPAGPREVNQKWKWAPKYPRTEEKERDDIKQDESLKPYIENARD